MAKESKIQGMMAGSSPKQKVMVVVVVIIFLFVGYQAIGLFSNGGEVAPTPAPAQPQAMTAASPQGQPAAAQPGTPPGTAQPGAPAPGAMPAPAQQQPQIQEVKLQPSEFLLAQQETQKQYVTAINQLQMLKIEKEIAETNQAIAKAKLETITAEKSVSDLIAKPLPKAPTPPSAYGDSLSGGAAPTDSTFSQPKQGSIPPPPISEGSLPEVPYVAISVSMQMNKWTAVLGYSGTLYNVSVGDVLPADGSKVISINKDGVMLRKDGQKRKISLVTSI